MPSASDTAYPRLKINPTAKELNELYSPTVYELAFAQERAGPLHCGKAWNGGHAIFAPREGA
jgi:hypothetical protein